MPAFVPASMSFPRVGVLGGGQLGRMLIAPALAWGLPLSFLAPRASLCQRYAKHFVEGEVQDEEAVLAFGADCDLLTIEIEDVHVGALARLEERGCLIYPSPRLIAVIQDKLKQKEFYRSHHFPTADFVSIESKEELMKHAHFLPAVQKLRKSGYDGKGVQILNTIADTKHAFLDKASILEKKVEFQKEIAILAARNSRGQIAVYEAVEMFFHPQAQVLEYLICPARLQPAVLKEARELVCELVQSLEVIGLLAVELFVTYDNKLLINEAAPRPHNSAHHSLDACLTDQFTQHLRAILNFHLGDTHSLFHAACLNILGRGAEGQKETDKGAASYHYQKMQSLLAMDQVYPYLYGKQEDKAFRKMGHINILAENHIELEKKIAGVQKVLGG